MVVWAGTFCGSYAAAHQALRNLAHVDVPVKQVERRTKQIGEERCQDRDATASAYAKLPLVERKTNPDGVASPPVAVVQMDGGRLQILDRYESSDNPMSVKKPGSHWREDKVGLLASMTSQLCTDDPCPQIPATFVDPGRIPQMAQEIKAKTKAVGREEQPSLAPEAQAESDSSMRYEAPELVTRSVVATKQGVEVFGQLLAAAAWSRGFYGSERKAFLGDGSNANWGVWESHFSSFTPILDFIHALTYVYSGAMAGSSFTEGWRRYVTWIEAVWQGKVAWVIVQMEAYQRIVGVVEAGDGETHPRRVLAEALGYLCHQQGRMDYPEYRRAGLPITTCHVESTIKQINQRVKGSEKFWSEPGSEAILQLRADLLSETEPLTEFWDRRAARQSGERRYNVSA